MKNRIYLIGITFAVLSLLLVATTAFISPQKMVDSTFDGKVNEYRLKESKRLMNEFLALDNAKKTDWEKANAKALWDLEMNARYDNPIDNKIRKRADVIRAVISYINLAENKKVAMHETPKNEDDLFRGEWAKVYLDYRIKKTLEYIDACKSEATSDDVYRKEFRQTASYRGCLDSGLYHTRCCHDDLKKYEALTKEVNKKAFSLHNLASKYDAKTWAQVQSKNNYEKLLKETLDFLDKKSKQDRVLAKSIYEDEKKRCSKMTDFQKNLFAIQNSYIMLLSEDMPKFLEEYKDQLKRAREKGHGYMVRSRLCQDKKDELKKLTTSFPAEAKKHSVVIGSLSKQMDECISGALVIEEEHDKLDRENRSRNEATDGSEHEGRVYYVDVPGKKVQIKD